MKKDLVACLSDEIQALESDFQNYLSPESQIKFEQEALFAVQALRKNSYLAQVATNNPQSLRDAIFNLAAIGLTLNPIEKQAYLIPRDGQVCLDISYMGLCDLATSNGEIIAVRAVLVHANDTLEITGISTAPNHSYQPFGDRGDIVGVYCCAILPSGIVLSETMTLAECHAIRNRTDIWKKHQKGPWLTDEGEMIKKTVIKRAAKLWPAVNRFKKAIDVLNSHEGIDFEQERKEQIEAHEREQREKSEAIVVEMAEKKSIIEEIKAYSAILTKGKTIEQKGAFMVDNLGVNRFDDLLKKPLIELETILNNLKDEV